MTLLLQPAKSGKVSWPAPLKPGPEGHEGQSDFLVLREVSAREDTNLGLGVDWW